VGRGARGGFPRAGEYNGRVPDAIWFHEIVGFFSLRCL
jgi:hypothetical protein